MFYQSVSKADTRVADNAAIVIELAPVAPPSAPPSASSASSSSSAASLAVTSSTSYDNEENAVNVKHDRYVLAFYILMVIDSICFLKYFLPATVILRLVGGPVWLIFPFALWLLFNSFMQIVMCIGSNDEPKGAYQFAVTPISRCFNCSRGETVVDKYTFSMNSGVVGFYITWSIIDMLLSLILGGVGVLICIVFFIEPDGLVCVGWRPVYNIACTGVAFLLLSFLAKTCIVFMLSMFICCKRSVVGVTAASIVTDTAVASIDGGSNSNTVNDRNVPIIFVASVSTAPQLSAPAAVSPSIDEQRSCITNYKLNLSSKVLSVTYYGRICMILSSAILLVIAFCYFFYAIHHYIRSIQAVPTGTYGDCDPMVTRACSLPYPSNYWLVDDASTSSGYRVQIDEATFPYTRGRNHMTTDHVNQYDGFSVSAGILWYLPNVDYSQLVSHTSIDSSLSYSTSTTLLLDLSTYKLFPHFTEADYLDLNSDERVLYIQPSRALKFSTRYVSIVKDLTDEDGSLIERSAVVSTYVNAYKNNLLVLPDDDRYSRIYPALLHLDSVALIDIDSIQLIWDFDTASEDSILSKLTSLYAPTVNAVTDAINNAKSTDDIYTLTGEIKHDCDIPTTSIAVELYYRVDVPWYMHSLDRQDNYIDKTIPTYDGDVGLFVQIPCSIMNDAVPMAGFAEYGHGIFGDRSNAVYPWLITLANTNGYVLWSMDYRGFSRFDYPPAGELLMHKIAVLKNLEASVIQGYQSKLAGGYIVEYIIQKYKMPNGYDSNASSWKRIYIGESMGSILGSGYIAFSKHTDASVLLVGGSPFTFLIGRSSIFQLFLYLLQLQFYTFLDMRIAINSLQIVLDAAESSGWSNTNYYKNNGNILSQVGLGDSTVTTISSEILARNVDAELVTPSWNEIDGINDAATPVYVNTAGKNYFFEGKYTKDYKALPTDSRIPESNNVHGCFASNYYVAYQNTEFLATSTVINPCGNSSPCTLDDRAKC